MRKFVVVVAGGTGTRMGTPISKQYLEIGGLPILMHTLSVFYQYDPSIELILVIPEDDFEFWQILCKKYRWTTAHQLVAGGKSRFQSVKMGIAAIREEEGLVAIHDGVRPFVKPKVIKRGFEVAEINGSAIAVMPIKDSIRKVGPEGSSVFQERDLFRIVQTPQTFQLAKIRSAFRQSEQAHFTDDATVYEQMGWQVSLISGNPENIKITTPEDLEYASYLTDRK